MLRGNHLTGFNSGDNHFVLDVLSTPASVAYGLRRLRKSYVGLGIRVQRASDDVETDIGFQGERLDWNYAIAFKGASTLGVKTWYDQSGNGKDAAQATKANQPTLDTTNKRIDFDGTNDVLVTPSVDLSGTNKVTEFLVFRTTRVTSGFMVVTAHSTGGNLVQLYTSADGVTANIIAQTNNGGLANFDSGGNIGNGNIRLVSAVIDRSLTGAALVAGRLNGAAMTAGSSQSNVTGNFANTTVSIGDAAAGGNPFTGSIKERILLPVACTSTEIDVGQGNINVFHGIF